MRTSRKIAKKLVSIVTTTGIIGGSLAAGAVQFAADVMDEGVQAFEAIGEHVEKKLEEMDQDA